MDVHGLERTVIGSWLYAVWPPRGGRWIHAGGLFMIRRLGLGGAEEIRTPDLLLAKETLYQLSHGP
jgi:hypothetical protein